MGSQRSKRITFFALNASYSHSMLSYGYLRAFTEEKMPEWKWSLVEKTINDNEDNIIKELLDSKPDILVSTCYLFNIEFTIRIIKKIKKQLPEVHIFLGGPEFLGDNRYFLTDTPEIDGVFRGDETSFFEVLKDLKDRDPWKNIAGICYLEKDNYTDNGISSFQGSLDEIPSPFKKGLFQESKPFAHFETSRGCSGKCSFCTSSISDGIKTFSLERVSEDLKFIQAKNVKEIRLIDRTFNESEKRTLALLDMFYNDFSDIRFHLEINPSKVTPCLVECLKQFDPEKLHIEVGIQSCSPEILKAVKRYGSATKSVKGIKDICSLTDIPVHADLIFGLPGQSFGDVIHDVVRLIEFNPDEIQLENLKILPGTPLRKIPEKQISWNPNPPYQVLKSKTFSPEELSKLKVLSLILDCYYNMSWLKNLFRYMCKMDPGFIDSFLNFYLKKVQKTGKLSFQDRFEIIEPFTENNDISSDFFKFSWLSAGLPRTKFGLKTFLTLPNTGKHTLIWKNPKDFPSKRNITVSFPCDIASLWLDNNQTVKHKETSYIFNIAYGNVISSIAELQV
jgi:radical SAM superfamily enzyme YgiQ (UPF0313 family)